MSRRHSRRRLEPKQSRQPDFPFRPPNAQAGRKKLQLCRQVQEALTWALGTAIHDDYLSDCSIAAVEPLPGGNRLLVKVNVPPGVPFSEMTDRLTAAGPALRTEVAQAITRRKAPELVFVPIPATG